MTSSRWHAHGNVYLVAETDEYTMEPGLDGVMQVLEIDGDDVHVAIVNPDGSLAEMSGNGTRIAAAWLMDRTGSDVARVHVGPRVVEVRRVGERLYESDMGEVEVGARETVDGIEFTPVDVGNPHAVVRRRSRASCRRSARCSRRIRASRTGRTCRSRASTRRAR